MGCGYSWWPYRQLRACEAVRLVRRRERLRSSDTRCRRRRRGDRAIEAWTRVARHVRVVLWAAAARSAVKDPLAEDNVSPFSLVTFGQALLKVLRQL